MTLTCPCLKKGYSRKLKGIIVWNVKLLPVVQRRNYIEKVLSTYTRISEIHVFLNVYLLEIEFHQFCLQEVFSVC